MIVSYRRVSTDRQDIGLDAQKAAIGAWAAMRGVTVDLDFVEKASAGNMWKRPELAKAVSAAQAHGGVLVVAKLDRLSRNLGDFVALVEASNREGFQIVVCDLNIDMTTPSGRLIANIMASLAEWERSMISIRIKEAMAVNRQRGIHPGRPVSSALVRRIHNMHVTGMSLHSIARAFDLEGIPTAGGGKKWHPSTVRGVLRRAS